MSFNNEKSNGSSLGGTSAFGNPQHSSYKWWVLANIMIGTFMAVLDSTIVNVSLPRIMAAFGITVDKAEWVINGYLLAFAVMLPSSGGSRTTSATNVCICWHSSFSRAVRSYAASRGAKMRSSHFASYRASAEE